MSGRGLLRLLALVWLAHPHAAGAHRGLPAAPARHCLRESHALGARGLPRAPQRPGFLMLREGCSRLRGGEDSHAMDQGMAPGGEYEELAGQDAAAFAVAPPEEIDEAIRALDHIEERPSHSLNWGSDPPSPPTSTESAHMHIHAHAPQVPHSPPPPYAPPSSTSSPPIRPPAPTYSKPAGEGGQQAPPPAHTSAASGAPGQTSTPPEAQGGGISARAVPPPEAQGGGISPFSGPGVGNWQKQEAATAPAVPPVPEEPPPAYNQDDIKQRAETDPRSMYTGACESMPHSIAERAMPPPAPLPERSNNPPAGFGRKGSYGELRETTYTKPPEQPRYDAQRPAREGSSSFASSFPHHSTGGMTRTSAAGRYVYITGGVYQRLPWPRPVPMYIVFNETEEERARGWGREFAPIPNDPFWNVSMPRRWKFMLPSGGIFCFHCNGPMYGLNLIKDGMPWEEYGTKPWWARGEAACYRIDTYKDTLSFERIQDMKTPRFMHAAASYHGRCLVSGGRMRTGNSTYWSEETGGVLASVEWHQPGLNEWTPLGNMWGPRIMHAMVVLDSQIYVIGGYNDRRMLIKWVERYDPTQNLWREEVAPNEHRVGLTACALGGKIYITGGYNDIHPERTKCTMPRREWLHVTDITEAFDPVEREWEIVAPMHVARSIPSSCVWKGEWWVAGGWNQESERLTCVESYNPKTNTWTKRADLPHDMVDFAMAVVPTEKGQALCTFGGVIDQDLFQYGTDAIFRYDLRTDEWVLLNVTCPSIFWAAATTVV